jgi:hypothetical protein
MNPAVPQKDDLQPMLAGKSPDLPQVCDMFEEFVAKLEEFLGVSKSVVDVEKEWTKDDPMETGKSFEEEFLRARQTPFRLRIAGRGLY